MKIPKPKEITQIRKRAHMTIDEFAAEFSLTPHAVRFWENGHSKPRPETAKKILLIARNLDYIDLLKAKGVWPSECQKMQQGLMTRGETFLGAMKIILTEIAEKFEDLRVLKNPYSVLIHTLDKELLTAELKRAGRLKQDKNGHWVFNFK